MKTRLTVVLAVLAALGGTPAFAAPIPVQVKVQQAGDQVKLILDWKGKVEYKVHRAGANPAMVVELTPAKLAAGMQRFPIQKGLIGVIEATQADADTVKVKIPVMNPPVFTASSRGPQGGLQLLISTMDVDTGGRVTAAAPRPAASPAPAAAAPRPAASASPAAPRPAATGAAASNRPTSRPPARPSRPGVEEISALQNRPTSAPSAPAAASSPAPASAPAAAPSPAPAPVAASSPAAPASPPEVSPAPAVSSTAPPAAGPSVNSGPAPTSSPTSPTSQAASRPAAAPAPVSVAPAPAPAPRPAPAAAPAPAPRPAPASSAPMAAANIPSREYSLTLAGQDLRAVLTDLAKDMGLRPAIDPAVKGTVTTTIFNLDAQSTVEAILRTQQPTTYLYRFTATELQVFPAGSAGAAARPAPAPAPAVATSAPSPTVTVAPGDPGRIRDYFPIALPKKAAQLAEGLRVLCPGATVRVDGPMNVILVEASPADMDQVRRVLQAVGD